MRIFLILSALGLAACQTAPPPTAASLQQTLPGDERTLATLKAHEAGLERSFLEFRDAGKWESRGYFSARETDQAELLLFRLHTAHQMLADISGRYSKLGDAPALQQRGRELHVRAHQLAVQEASFLVETFSDDPIAVAQFNEAYPRSNLPRHTYDQLAASLERFTPAHLEAFEKETADLLNDSAYSLQSAAFYRVSRIKAPGAHLVQFSASQKEEVLSLLRPGDIILTFTAGYASDVFIPGDFKHSITFVGTPAQREAAGLGADRLTRAAGPFGTSELSRFLGQSRTTDGRFANLIEAVAEGVKFSNLDHIMDTHINRLVVLRPGLTPEERAIFLGRIFSFLGQQYDFRFDFADASHQVCTELTWRALSGLEGLSFPLTKRGGHLNLSADDIVHYWLEKNPDAFECVLYAEEAPLSPGHRGKIYTGPDALPRLKALVQGNGA